MTEKLPPLETLQWYQAIGIDETIAEEPVNRFEIVTESIIPVSVSTSVEETKPATLFQSAPSQQAPMVNVQTDNLASKAQSLDELRQLMLGFDECPLKSTAANMVFGMGNPKADLMIIGEAPGAEEDKQGLPFVGASGKLLDLMLKSIGMNRTDVYISNILPWRPPGNRKPSEAEVALFTPFIRRHIALVNPKILLLLGGSAVSALLQINQGITRSRGKWMSYIDKDLTIDAFASFHPAFLLRTPAQKKASWRDFLTVKQRLSK